MYDPIVLALDGSTLAETGIPHAIAVATAFDATILVVRVVPPIVGPEDLGYGSSAYTYEHLMDAETKAAEAYLSLRVKDLVAQGVRADGICRVGEPASTVVDIAAEKRAGLLVIATHGRSGIARWLLGSVADRVVRAAGVPVLLIRAGTADA